jgi:uncharacterized protein YaaR (DUF327 family)
MSISSLGQFTTLNQQFPAGNLGQNPLSQAQLNATDKTKGPQAPEKAPNFLEKLINQQANLGPVKPSLEDMKTRLSEILKKGAILRQHPTPGVLDDYVASVKGFLNDVRDNAYSPEKKDGLFQHLNTVDEHLDKLAKQFLAEQKPEMKLVDSLGELEGLLIDIFV